jgi:hypothetical protein
MGTLSFAGVEVAYLDVEEMFNIAPFSNLTDWESPPYVDFRVTAYGELAGWNENYQDGTALPYTYYSPGIVSRLWVWAEGQMRQPPPLFPRRGIKLNAYVNSPGLFPNDPLPEYSLCQSDFTFPYETPIDPPDAIGDAVAWCFNHWWWCTGPIGLGPFF